MFLTEVEVDTDVIAVSDDSDESDNDRSYHRKRRAAAKQQVNYHEISDSGSAVSDMEQRAVASRRSNTAVTSAKQSRRRKDSGSEYQPSSGPEDTSTLVSCQTASRCKRLGSGSEESGSAAISKKKGRLNRIMSSSDYSSSDDDNPRTDIEKAPALNGDHQKLPVVNGKDRDDAEPDEFNAASETGKGFTIANLLKTSDRTVRSEIVSESSDEDNFAEDDSLSGIEDLIDYVTQS